MRSTYTSKIKSFFKYFSGFIIAVPLLIAGMVQAATMYSSGSLLQPNDVTSVHIRDNTIVNADVSQTTAFTLSSSTIQTLHTGVLFATSSATLTATTTFGTMAWHMPQTDGTSGQVMTTDGAGNLSLATVSQPYVSTSFTAGETITAGQTVSIGDGGITTVTPAAIAGSDAGDVSSTYWTAQSYTTPSTSVVAITQATMTIALPGGAGGGPNNWTISVRTDNAGSPSTTVLGSGTVNTGTTAGDVGATVVFATPIAITSSTKYWFVLSFSGTAPLRRTDSTAGAGNVGKYTSNSGSTWTAFTNDYLLGLVFTTNTLGAAYKASSATTDYRFKDFVGFATNSVSAGQTVTVAEFGWLSLFSGLTIGGTYYLNDTQGAIGTSAGSQSLIVGRGITATQLMTRNP